MSQLVPLGISIGFLKKKEKKQLTILCNSPDFYFSFLLIPFCYTISRPRTIKKKRWRHDTPGGAAQLLFRSFPSSSSSRFYRAKNPAGSTRPTARHTKTACVRSCLI
jgi:hypothetical protein